jgi:hypothetical protein
MAPPGTVRLDLIRRYTRLLNDERPDPPTAGPARTREPLARVVRSLDRRGLRRSRARRIGPTT